MPYVVKDRVKVTSTTTGTGTFTLGAAATGFQSFSAIAPNTAWSVITAYYLQALSVSAQETTPVDLFFKPDGTKMYVLGSSGDDVNEYNLSTAWDISTATYVQNFSVAPETSPSGLFFRSDGAKMYVCGTSADTVNEYNLSSAWDISTATSGTSFNLSTQDTNPQAIYFKDDGLTMFMLGSATDNVFEYSLGTAWNVSTATIVRSESVAAQDSGPLGLFFKSDGTKMYILGSSNDAVFEYNLRTAWNIDTAVYFQSYSVASQETAPQGLFFKSDGTKMYITGSTSDSVYEYDIGANSTYYCIANATDWEVGVGVIPPGGSLLYRTSVLESSNSNALVNWGAGSKDVFCTYPADATEGTVPTADNSSVGTDLYAWTNLKKQLDAGVINGVPYNNNGTAGMVSTYSLVYTTGGAYYGGVLAPNGDIHFVPERANRGQKISASGVVSTYALVNTGIFGQAYRGGVLASNGDIHFIPYESNVGQKINASGVVSTYSLVKSTGPSQNFFGGVLAPNGDIHFVPYGTNVGQKVSAAGVVSTYSLVYTTTDAYIGGVLAPNGDIHFIPYNANRGQKVSAAGVVSTYSLVYTANGYYGGVLAPNGDIHFVPYFANRGQKVSAAGVVSTYSLVYTVNNAYSGGVLAPNGDIHFVPYYAERGQKISAAGVVSTYSLVYTTAEAYGGGVLNSNGEIYFVSSSAERGQRISTNTTRPIGYALSPFFNKY